MKIQKAKLTDVKAIHRIIAAYAKKGLMLYRPVEEIEYKIRDYSACKNKDEVIGCAGLKVWNRNAAEIYALAVKEKYMGKGIGKQLVKKIIADAKNLGVNVVFTLTFRKELFTNLGFKKVGWKELPKVMLTEKTVDVDKAYGMKLTK
jgi:amino-acid N-acetyltransferase